MCYRVYSVYRAIEQEHEWSMNIHNVVLCNDKILHGVLMQWSWNAENAEIKSCRSYRSYS